MSNFLEQYGKAIFVLVLIAILIAFAHPIGIKIKEYTLSRAETTDSIGSNEIKNTTKNDNVNNLDQNIPVTDYLYAIQFTNGELAIMRTEEKYNELLSTHPDNPKSYNYGKLSILGENKSFTGGSISPYAAKYIKFYEPLKPSTCEKFFTACGNFTEIKNIEYLDTSAAISMKEMFSTCFSLKSLDLSHFNTSNVTDMSEMFAYCRDLTNLNMSNWNTSNVTDMSGMFLCCNSLKTFDLSHFDTTNVTDMNEMFYECTLANDINLKNFNTNNVINMNKMFANCDNLPDYSIHIGINWTIENAKQHDNVQCMFSGFVQNKFDGPNGNYEYPS